MKKNIIIFIVSLLPLFAEAQDLSQGFIVIDLSDYPMEEVSKPAYLDFIIDPSFGTTIRRITNASLGEVIVPMYSTIQAWNTDETLMILYDQSKGKHVLLDGITYEFIRFLEDVEPADLEQIFWDFNEPDIFYYPENISSDFIKYSVSSQTKEIIINLQEIAACDGEIHMGNDIQMMSWESDLISFRCNNSISYSYRISTQELTSFTIDELGFASPSIGPSGDLFYHDGKVYNDLGIEVSILNESSVEHSCMGKLTNGNDAHFAIAFAQGPLGGCIGDIIAHDLSTGECFPIISQSQGYDYPQSGTHISAIAHKNTEGGWIAASMIGYDQDGQSLLDQEIVIANSKEGEIKVCRIGHHRSDESQFDYWGEPHAVISPTGTRVLFGSDWSGEEDGQSIDSYDIELPTYNAPSALINQNFINADHIIFPNPAEELLNVSFSNPKFKKIEVLIYDINGKLLITDTTESNHFQLNTSVLISGLYFYRISGIDEQNIIGKFVKK